MIPILAAAATTLVSNGLGLLVNAITAKGKDVVEKQIGMKIPDDPKDITPEVISALHVKQMEHEEFLVNAAIKQKELDLQGEDAEQNQVSERWKADMTSDSWLSKNIRPLTLAYLTLFVTGCAVASPWLKIDSAWIELLKTGWLAVLTTYFVSRGVQHVMKTRTNKEAA